MRCWLIQPNRCAQNQSTLLACKKQTSLSTTINNYSPSIFVNILLMDEYLNQAQCTECLNPRTQGHKLFSHMGFIVSHDLSFTAGRTRAKVMYSHFIVIICALEQYLLFTQFKSKFEATTGSTVSFSNMNEGHYLITPPLSSTSL